MARRTEFDPDITDDAKPGNELTGHDTRSIGPSDSSDSGSDLIGPGLLLSDDDRLNLDRGTNDDSEGGHLDDADAGASIGDLGLDNNSDRSGTGERLTAGKDPDVAVGGDIAPDRIVTADEAGLGGGLDQAEEAVLGRKDEEIDEQFGPDGTR